MLMRAPIGRPVVRGVPKAARRPRSVWAPACCTSHARGENGDSIMTDTGLVAVIGAGQMGNGIAHVFAQGGFDVTMIDVSTEALERGRATIAGNLDRQIKKGAITQEQKDATLGRVKTAADVDAARGAM